MIVDAHVHHTWADPDAPPWEQTNATVDLARRAGIDRIVLLGTYSYHGVDPTPTQLRQCNDHAAQIVAAHPDHVVSLCYLNPAHDPAQIDGELDRCVNEYDMRGIKLWIAVNARDKRLDPVMRGAVRHDIPVFFHSWYKTIGWAYNESSPADMRDLALRHPDAKLVMLHITGGRERGVLDIADLPNVYVDTSGSQPDRGFVEFAVRHLGADRVIYGSDAPIRDYPSQLAKVQGAALDDAAKEKILSTNAARLLKLPHPKRTDANERELTDKGNSTA